MVHRIEIYPREGFADPHAEGVLTHIRELGIESVNAVKSARIFFLFGELDQAAAENIAQALLVDPVVEAFCVGSSEDDGKCVIEVHLQPGVMDPVAGSVEEAITDMGYSIRSVTTARRYCLAGDISTEQRDLIATRLLANGVIEDTFYAAHTPEEHPGEPYQLEIIEVPVRELDDAGLEKLSQEGDLFLNLTEMQAIRDHYQKLGREPRDVELEMIAQTWSEHCVHKTFRSDVRVVNNAGETVEEIPNLIKNTVFAATRQLDKPWCLNVFEDNAGVIEFDHQWGVCFKVETHNHPSAIEPYGGSMTGIGGVVRDPLGTGLGARPVANTDVFCFGDTNMALDQVPAGTLHPRRVMRGVVAGVRDYGNRMGIPTVNGAVYFDDRYIGNPLVFCGTVAMVPKDKCTKRRPSPGDLVVCVGGRTGRDGIHGATFSSGELTHTHETEFGHAVQIGNAITEKKMLETILQARDLELYSCITDCGAGGLSSAVGEMGEKIGAEIQLDRVPLKYNGLRYDEIWISEAQERMVLAVPEQNIETIMDLFAAEDVEATVIGHYGVADADGNPLLKLFYNEKLVGELDLEFVHDGLPRPERQALWDPQSKNSPPPKEGEDCNKTLLHILASPNVASKEWVIRQYDHEVQGGSVIKPLVGIDDDGPGDAAVVHPIPDNPRGVAISCGMNPRFGDLDPYQSALHAVDEALRNLVSVGGNLDRTAILDNFCWGNCDKPDRMGALVQSARACLDAATTYSTPFVSGKDSLNNEFRTEDGQTIAIPATLLISAMSVIEDISLCITSDAKAPGNLLYLLGTTRPELGGSHYLLVNNMETGNDIPPVDCGANLQSMRKLQTAIEQKLVRSCHDLSEGGLAVAAAEMAFSGGLGIDISLKEIVCEGQVHDIVRLFGESAGRFLVEIDSANKKAFETLLSDQACSCIGTVTETGKLVVDQYIDIPVAELKQAWQGTFNW